GPIPGMIPTQALTAIQTMADQSQKCHDGTSSRNISSNSNTDGLAAIVSKLDNLGRDMKKLKENVHAIQVGCQIYEGPHLDKECPLNEEVKQVEEVKYGKFRRPAPFNRSNGTKFYVGPPGYYTRTDNRPPYGEKRLSLEELMNKHQEESARKSAQMDEWIKKLQENAKINTRNQSASLKNLETQIEQLTKELQSRTTNGAPSLFTKQCKVVNDDHETPNIPISSIKLNNLHGVSFLSDSDSQVAQNNKERTTEVLQCKLLPKEQNPRNFTLSCTISNFNFYAMADLGASVNVMPRGIIEFMKLTNLRKTNMLIEMADMTKRYGGCQLNDLIWGQSYVEWYKENSHDNKPRPRDYTFKVLDLEIEQLADEYELGIGKKGHILEMIWENYKNIQSKAKEWWYDYWLEEDEKQENGDKKYDPPMVHMETFEGAFFFPTPSHDVGESSAAGVARQDGPAVAKEDPYSVARGDLYGFFDMVDVPPRLAQSALISELQSADHRRQRVISELLASDHKRQFNYVLKRPIAAAVLSSKSTAETLH
ncbi:hypothetical protein Tco_0958312, partial [Tanacetum coccineum]